MNFKIEFSDAAKIDLWEARDYYLKISETLLERFDYAFIDVIKRLGSSPENFQQRYRNVKIVFTKTFPYGIHYITENQTVYVQRVLHQKQLYN